MNVNKLKFCEAYALGEHHAMSFPNSTTQNNYPLQLVVCDLWGLAFNLSRNGFRY